LQGVVDRLQGLATVVGDQEIVQVHLTVDWLGINPQVSTLHRHDCRAGRLRSSELPRDAIDSRRAARSGHGEGEQEKETATHGVIVPSACAH